MILWLWQFGEHKADQPNESNGDDEEYLFKNTVDTRTFYEIRTRSFEFRSYGTRNCEKTKAINLNQISDLSGCNESAISLD